jgi:hypothetical protein
MKIYGYISFRKPKKTHPRVAKYHKMFEGNRENVGNLHHNRKFSFEEKFKFNKKHMLSSPKIFKKH